MRKKNTLIGMGLLIAVLVLGVGYAFNAIELTIGGAVNVTPNDENFKVIFSNAVAASGSDTATITDSNSTSITGNIEINSLTSVGQSTTVTYTVKNNSNAGIKAVIAPPVITKTSSGEYFEVTTDWSTTADTEIPSVNGNTKDLVITVTLVKAPVDETIEGNFSISLTANAETEA